ncbi:uncharacterized protein UMAG_01226 [Mycosarcoma maydis]|uniref:Uncharacterized protein n=1 Tax=Mycosarcoma maydis TaxID=5270 RepID=A0A0D1E6W3_MYCMD|nr:uncharacterized protein UMAG_01226 [Ustilago maydis 521]KIS71326.1 hypothetical protein UMAG_01226 [Ustilago maydis 521]|eukprot:XP_011387160.1 hypothetical protein UMAG_01226 [Ustilago maydis 521]
MLHRQWYKLTRETRIFTNSVEVGSWMCIRDCGLTSKLDHAVTVRIKLSEPDLGVIREETAQAIQLRQSGTDQPGCVAHSATTCRIHGVALRFPFALRMVSRPFILTPGADPPTNASSFAKIAADSGQPKKHLAQP